MSFKAYKYKLKPTDSPKTDLKQFGGLCRFVYNYFLALAINTYHNEQHQMGYNEMAELLTQLKRAEEYRWLQDVHSQVLQQSLTDLETAYKNFFRKLKNGDLPKILMVHSKTKARTTQGESKLQEGNEFC